jgi:dUTP pyrophosphatase
MKSTLSQIEKYASDNSMSEAPIELPKILGIDLEELEKTSFITEEDIPKMEVKYVNKSNNQDPEYAHKDDSGFDLRADLDESTTINPLQRKLIPTGLYFELPENYELQVRPRSGLALKHGITVLNTPGTVDRSYIGEIKVILINLGDVPFIINPGDRIAQAVLNNIVNTNWAKYIKVSKLKSTDRDTGGFGSTGIK